MPSLNVRRPLSRLACLLALLIPVAAASASEHRQVNPQQAQYQRWHDSAVAFSEAVGRLAPQYADLRGLDMKQVRQIIADSEQAAQQRDFESAGYHARRAYEIQRAAITAAVGGPATTQPR